MSVADLKTRLADVPGIETLTMGFEAGRIALRWGAYAASVDAAASDHDIEMAVRDAIKLPPVTMIPDKPVAVAAPAQATVKPMSITGASAAGHSLREIMEDNRKQLSELTAVHIESIKAGFAKQLQGVQALGRLAQKVDAEGDEFLALIGQYTNDLGFGE